jgi:hypothetical protein
MIPSQILAISSNSATETNEDILRLTAGYDVWYAMWEVEGFAANVETNEYGNADYNIEPALIQGFTVSAGKGYTNNGSWGLLFNYYSVQIGKESSEATDKKSEYFRAFFSYVMSKKSQILTNFQSGKFRGELDNNYQFETEWTKVDILIAEPDRDRFLGLGVRFLRYEMPVEFAIIDTETGDDLGHEVYLTETQGVAFILKVMDPINFGYYNNKWYFLDYDIAFGISKAEADELVDDVYGFQFNSELNLGLKK